MHSTYACDEDLVRRLPLPLAQLYRQAANAKSPLDRHLTAYYLWEAALKLLASAAIVTYADQNAHDPKVGERLKQLARPALGHWWEFTRLLVPLLADAGDTGFAAVRDLLLGRTRDDLPRAAGLDAVLRDVLGLGSGARTTVRLSELFDRLVQYRNRELAHGAAGQRPHEFYERVGNALLTGLPEVFYRLDVLAGRRLIYVSDVRRHDSGAWSVERFDLIGEAARSIASLEIPESEAGHLPHPKRLFLERPPTADAALPSSLHPLVIYDLDTKEVLFLNSRRGKLHSEYLCYSTGRSLERKNFGEQRELLRRALDVQFADDEVQNWAARSQAEEGPSVEPTSISRTIGEFELLSVLGRGGMGVVYRAWQPSLGRQVALKCLTHTGDKAEDRFRGEIRALGQVTHPHLVRIYTSGADGDRWFYAMELLEGATLAAVSESLQDSRASAADMNLETWHKTLSTVCEQTRQSEKQLSELSTEAIQDRSPTEAAPVPPMPGDSYVRHIVELVRQVAIAAHALHQAQPHRIIHRDIKPGNIVVRPDGSQAVLMDLGLAQFADELDRKLTRTRQFVGTLRYASPEQVLAVDRLDPRTDVYSLGATLWELLSLRPMFGADEQLPTPEIMKRIQYAEPERLRQYNPGVPTDLEAVVLKCLEKDSSRRYTSASELADDLGRWLRGEPVQAQRGLGYLLNKFARRHRPRLATIATIFLVQIALVLTGYFAILSYDRDYDPPNTKSSTSKSELASRGADHDRRMADSKVPKANGGQRTWEGIGRTTGDSRHIEKQFAVLVGCTRYDHLPPLKGSGNDVQLMQNLLVQRFAFPKENIVTLVDANGPNRPTRANIEREIHRLAQVAEPSSNTFVFLAGYGSQQPNDSAGANADLEPDGLDEVFLPEDTGKWDGERHTVVNAIRDDELRDWLQKIRDSGANVWLVQDSSAAGTILRGQDVVLRTISPDTLIPEGVLSEARKTALSHRGISDGHSLEVPREMSSNANFVIHRASTSMEPTFELPLPLEGHDQKVYGLFTYTFNQVLLQALGPASYKDIAKRIQDRYHADGRFSPVPVIEGYDLDRFVLGRSQSLDEWSLLAYPASTGGQIINAGTLYGLRVGSVLSVKPPAGQGDDIIGHVRVSETSTFASTVDSCEFGGVPASNDFPPGARCKLVYVDLGDLRRIKVAVDEKTHAGDSLPSSTLQQLRMNVSNAIATAGFFVSSVDDLKQANWLIQRQSLQSDALFLVPATETRNDQGRSRGVEFGPLPADQLEVAIQTMLGKVFRSENLLAMASLSESRQETIRPGIDVGLELLRFASSDDQIGVAIGWQSGGITLHTGDHVGFQIANKSEFPVDVTVFFLDSANGIQVLFPRSIADNRLYSNSKTTVRARINGDTTGTEHVVLLATEAAAGSPVQDFAFLAQPTIELARSFDVQRGIRERVLNTEVGRLFQNSFYSAGNTRGVTLDLENRFALRKVSWSTAAEN